MGFTRTSEGRVFFKGADNDDAPRNEQTASTPTTPAQASPAEGLSPPDQTQMQILLLLKSLNAKLKTSKEEQAALKRQLAAHRETIKKLRDKTQGAEANYIDLEQNLARKQTEAQKQVMRVEDTLKETLKQLEEARHLVTKLEGKSDSSTEVLNTLKAEVEERKKEEEKLLKRQKDLEKAQAAQGEKMVDGVAVYVALTKRVSEAETRQAALDNKIEETTSEYLKLDRKIEKALEDRNRILRKIERIEAAVLETKDALSAKAMVLLTQQETAKTGAPSLTTQAMEFPLITDSAPARDGSNPPEDTALSQLLKGPIKLSPALLAGLLLLVLLVGLGLSALFLMPRNEGQTPQTQSFSSTEPMPLMTERLETASVKAEPLASEPPTQTQPAQPLALDNDPGITTRETSAPIDLTAPENDRARQAAMEEEPERLAAALNSIEPSALPAPETPTAAAAPPPAVEIDPLPIKPEPPIKRSAQEQASYTAELRAALKPDKDLPASAKRIEAQAFDGIPEAQHDMGALYVAGHNNVKQDLKRAVFWFEKAADNGIANAQYNLGVLYHQGMGVDKNLDKAIALYQRAAAQGHPEAQYNLGIANIEGIGVPYNPQKAAQFFENAANKNIMEAAYNLGLIYENGLLGETHPDKALLWYKTAADNGSPEAKAALEQLAASLGITLSDVNRIVDKTRGERAQTSSPPASQTDIIAQIQNELMARGLYPGPVDGKNGPMTANAIKSFQSAANIAADGIPSAELLTLMRTARN